MQMSWAAGLMYTWQLLTTPHFASRNTVARGMPCMADPQNAVKKPVRGPDSHLTGAQRVPAWLAHRSERPSRRGAVSLALSACPLSIEMPGRVFTRVLLPDRGKSPQGYCNDDFLQCSSTSRQIDRDDGDGDW